MATTIDTSSSTAKINTLASNIQGSGSNGEKGFTVSLNSNVIPTGSNGYKFSGTTAITTATIDTAGDIQSSSNNLSLAINGPGFTPVCRGSDTTNGIFLTRSLNCSLNAQGYLVTDTGYTILGWHLDDQGRMPGAPGNSNTQSSGSVNSLSAVNLDGLSSKPKATTEANFDARLNSGQPVITGAGQSFIFDSSDTLNGGISTTDVIIPSGTGITQGDNFSITINGIPTTYEFGGVANTVNINTQTVMGATSAASQFQSAPTAVNSARNGRAVDQDTLSLEIGSGGSTNTFKLKYVASGTPTATNYEFNSLSTLSAALSEVPGITSKVVNGVMYVAAQDGASAITFTNTGSGGTLFTQMLGLSNVAAYSGSNLRYSTLDQLQKNLQLNPALSATQSTTNSGLNINALDPMQNVTFTANSLRSVAFTTVSGTQTDITTSATQTATSLKIQSPNSGLQVGDYVNLSQIVLDDTSGLFNGTAYTIPAGIYIVESVDAGGFTIGCGQQIYTTGTVGDPSIATVTNAPTWQKVPGFVDSSTTKTFALNNKTMTSAAVANGAYAVTITNATNGLVAGDVVHITGVGTQNGVVIPNGTYVVTAAAANTSFTISVPQIQGIPGGVGPAAISSGSVTKVGTSSKAAALPTTGELNYLETSSVFQASPNVATPTNVRIYMPDHGFVLNDYLRFNGANTPTVLAGGTYQVASVGNGYFEINLGTAANVTSLLGSVPTAPTGAVVGDLPSGVTIDYCGKFDSYVGFNEAKDGNIMGAVFDASDGSGKNVVTGGFEVFTSSVTVYDGLGNPLNLSIGFVKTGISEWTYQLYTQKNATTNTYPLSGLGQDGIITTGLLTFNGLGALQSVTGGSNIALNWLTGSLQTHINLNFGPAGINDTNIFTTGGVKHTNGTNQIYSVSQDGYAPGKFLGISIDPTNGNIVASYDNGQMQAIYALPVVYVPSPNNMLPVGNATFQTTNNSGSMILKQSGQDGMGSYIGSSIELSNIDNNSQMVDLITETTRASYLNAAQRELNNVQKQLAQQ